MTEPNKRPVKKLRGATANRMKADANQLKVANANKRVKAGAGQARPKYKKLEDYAYDKTDYTAAVPEGLSKTKKSKYETYTASVAQEFSTIYARNLDRLVDEARGNGRYEGRDNKSRRYAYEKKYLESLGFTNIGRHCEDAANKVENDSIKQDKEKFDIYTSRPRVSGCPHACELNHKMSRQCADIGGGYVNIKDYVAEVQKHDPYCVVDTVVKSAGNVSGSGFHRVTIAPTIDDKGEVVIDAKTGLPKMTVYSFNLASKTPLEKYGQTHGVCFNINDFARHNLKEEYEKNPEITQTKINDYVKQNNLAMTAPIPKDYEENRTDTLRTLQTAIYNKALSNMKIER